MKYWLVSWRQSEQARERRHGVVFGVLFRQLRQVQRFGIGGSKLLDLPISRFLTAVQEVPCSVSNIAAEQSERVVHNKNGKRFGLLAVVRTAAQPLFVDVESHAVVVPPRVDQTRAEQGRASDAAVPAFATLKLRFRNGSVLWLRMQQASGKIREGDAGYVRLETPSKSVQDPGLTLYHEEPGDARQFVIKNEKPLQHDSVFRLGGGSATESPAKCYINSPAANATAQCPGNLPFMPACNASVSIASSMGPGLLYDVEYAAGGKTRLGIVRCEPDARYGGRRLTLKLLRAPPGLAPQTNFARPRMLRFDQDARSLAAGNAAVNPASVRRFRGPYIESLAPTPSSDDVGTQKLHRCSTENWSAALASVRLYQREKPLLRKADRSKLVFIPSERGAAQNVEVHVGDEARHVDGGVCETLRELGVSLEGGLFGVVRAVLRADGRPRAALSVDSGLALEWMKGRLLATPEAAGATRGATCSLHLGACTGPPRRPESPWRFTANAGGGIFSCALSNGAEDAARCEELFRRELGLPLDAAGSCRVGNFDVPQRGVRRLTVRATLGAGDSALRAVAAALSGEGLVSRWSSDETERLDAADAGGRREQHVEVECAVGDERVVTTIERAVRRADARAALSVVEELAFAVTERSSEARVAEVVIENPPRTFSDDAVFVLSREALGLGQGRADVALATRIVTALKRVSFEPPAKDCASLLLEGESLRVEPSSGQPLYLCLKRAVPGANEHRREYFRNIRVHPNDSVAAYIHAHDSPADVVSFDIPTARREFFASLRGAASSRHVVDGDAAHTREGAYRHRHRADALATLQLIKDREQYGRYTVLRNPGLSFAGSDGPVTPDGFLISEEQGEDGAASLRIGGRGFKIDALVETESRADGAVASVPDRLRSRVESGLRSRDGLAAGGAWLVSWSPKQTISHLFALDAASQLQSEEPLLSRSAVMAVRTPKAPEAQGPVRLGTTDTTVFRIDSALAFRRLSCLPLHTASDVGKRGNGSKYIRGVEECAFKRNLATVEACQVRYDDGSTETNEPVDALSAPLDYMEVTTPRGVYQIFFSDAELRQVAFVLQDRRRCAKTVADVFGELAMPRGDLLGLRVGSSISLADRFAVERRRTHIRGNTDAYVFEGQASAAGDAPSSPAPIREGSADARCRLDMSRWVRRVTGPPGAEECVMFLDLDVNAAVAEHMLYTRDLASAGEDTWRNWWLCLLTLYLLDPDDAKLVIQIDPDVKTEACTRAAIQAVELYAEMLRDAGEPLVVSDDRTEEGQAFARDYRVLRELFRGRKMPEFDDRQIQRSILMLGA